MFKKKAPPAPSPTPPFIARRWPLAFAVFGVFICLAAVLPVTSGLAIINSNDTRNRLLSGDDIPPAELDTFIAERQRLVKDWPSGDGYDDLTQALSLRAQKKGILKKESITDMLAAIEAQRQALALHPANTYGWSRLASLHLIAHGPSALVTQALLRSIQSAPFEPRLMVSRIVTLMRTEPYWDNDLRDFVNQQMRLAWLPFYRHDMTKAALQNGFIDRLYEALKDDPDGTKTLIELEIKYRPWFKLPPIDRTIPMPAAKNSES